MNGLIVLAAGGTGGHLFPAQALAGVLARRGWKIVVMTDARFANFATHFPGARIETVPSSPFSSILAPFRIAAGIAAAFLKLLRLKPDAVIGFGGYPSVPVMLGAVAANLPTAVIEQNTVMGRANRLVQDRVGKALLVLKPDDRAVVVLKHFMDFSYEEIADVLEVPVKTVKSRLFTARDRLREALREPRG